MSVSCELLEVLMHEEILHIPALPLRPKESYADIALITACGSVRIIAEGFDLPTEEEVFFLDLDTFDPSTYWTDVGSTPAWPPSSSTDNNWSALDLGLRLKEAGLGDALHSDRTVKFYRNAEAAQAGISSRGLAGAAAIVFIGSFSDNRVLIYAAPEIACSVQVICDPVRISTILGTLEEVVVT